MDRAAVLARLQAGTVVLTGAQVAALLPLVPATVLAGQEARIQQDTRVSQAPAGQQLTFD